MPFKSEAQRKWMHANHPKMAERWEEHTGKKKLPEYADPKHSHPFSSYPGTSKCMICNQSRSIHQIS